MSGYSVIRAENGQVRLTLNNVKNFSIGEVGTATGNMTFSLGNTGQATDETVLQIGQTQDDNALLFVVDDEASNLEFYGSDIEARFNSKADTQYNVQWQAKDSKLDSSKGNGSLLINTTERAQDNTFLLGKALSGQDISSDYSVDNMVVDNGKNSTFISDAKSANYFETGETSEGATIFGGNGNNTFLINGDDSIVVSGSSDDIFITGEKSEKNILMGMDGDDNFVDFGTGNLISGGKGYEQLNVNGKNGLANLGKGEDYRVDISGGAAENAIFTGETMTAADLTVYNYKDFLNQYLQNNGITMAEFTQRVGLSEKASVYDIINALRDDV